MMSSSPLKTSPFLTPQSLTAPDTLALLHLRRDLSLPTILRAHAPPSNSSDTTGPKKYTGYAEGVVTNTRFGSFPHSTLLSVPWGSQIRASAVDTGSRGRKRKAPPDASTPDQGGPDPAVGPKAAVTASSGFLHILPPTPENWTSSLPHRTQVVYTPDYSYILHRLRVRPGSRLVESGSGSGSFTHASARAVFSGYPPPAQDSEGDHGSSKRRKTGGYGKVYSYEFHAQRAQKMREEIRDHGLEAIVQVTERDVYKEGFLLPPPSPLTSDDTTTNGHPTSPQSQRQDGQWISPLATAVFFDLPAPWLAIPHLTRTSTHPSRPSPLDPTSTVHICTFSPCIEQAQRTITTLRHHAWTAIEMVEVSHRRIDVRREHVGLDTVGIRGAMAVARDVDEAVARLREVEGRSRTWSVVGQNESTGTNQKQPEVKDRQEKTKKTVRFTDNEDEGSAGVEEAEEGKKFWKQGRLIHRPEPTLKTHTSYLVFAILPQEWSEEEEMAMREKWKAGATGTATEGNEEGGGKSRRQMKREARAARQVHKEEGESAGGQPQTEEVDGGYGMGGKDGGDGGGGGGNVDVGGDVDMEA